MYFEMIFKVEYVRILFNNNNVIMCNNNDKMIKTIMDYEGKTIIFYTG